MYRFRLGEPGYEDPNELFYWTAFNGPLADLGALYRAGAAVQRSLGYAAALHRAAAEARYDLARFLLERGADPNARDFRGYTPLIAMVRSDPLRETTARVADLLLAYGMSLTKPDSAGVTPLQHAAEAAAGASSAGARAPGSWAAYLRERA